MKSNYLVYAIAIIGILVLFFFPEPATNFLAYLATAITFILLIVFLKKWQKKKK